MSMQDDPLGWFLETAQNNGGIAPEKVRDKIRRIAGHDVRGAALEVVNWCASRDKARALTQILSEKYDLVLAKPAAPVFGDASVVAERVRKAEAARAREAKRANRKRAAR